jgi:hypothetical protein
MERVRIDSFDINCKSAFRNLKNAILVGAMLFTLCTSAMAQQPAGKVPRVGFLDSGSASGPQTAVFREAFLQGLRDLGYVEGKKHQHRLQV